MHEPAVIIHSILLGNVTCEENPFSDWAVAMLSYIMVSLFAPLKFANLITIIIYIQSRENDSIYNSNIRYSDRQARPDHVHCKQTIILIN